MRGLAGDEEAQDTLQDVLVLIYRKLRGLDNPDVFRPWAFRLASRAGFRRLLNAIARRTLHAVHVVQQTVALAAKRDDASAR